jgi:DNA mismatch endonuclease (patch repair protein)
MRPPKPADPRRRALMSRVRQRGTDAELAVATALRQLGVTYRLNVISLPGSPDFANRTGKWAIFVHGCFWHQHTGCKRATVPKTNTDFWHDKFLTNRGRDARAIRELRRLGYSVVVVWECEVANVDRLSQRLQRVADRHRVQQDLERDAPVKSPELRKA